MSNISTGSARSPLGADEHAIHQWSVLQKWPVKVIKALTPGEWLIGSASPPPEGWLMFNDHTVLTVPVPQKSRERGIAPQAKPARAEAGQDHRDSTDPWQDTDPWKDYYRSQQKPAPARALPSSSVSLRPVQPDASTGARFQAQDERLRKLEDAVTNLQKGQEQQALQAANDKEVMQNNLQALGAQFSASLESMQQAQQRQQEQLFAGFTELKQIVLAQHNEPSKKQRSSPPPNMEVDKPTL